MASPWFLEVIFFFFLTCIKSLFYIQWPLFWNSKSRKLPFREFKSPFPFMSLDAFLMMMRTKNQPQEKVLIVLFLLFKDILTHFMANKAWSQPWDENFGGPSPCLSMATVLLMIKSRLQPLEGSFGNSLGSTRQWCTWQQML